LSQHKGVNIVPASTALVSDHADRDLERRVVSFLFGRHMPGLRHVSVKADRGTVTLHGRVHSFYEKQLCQVCCRRVAGVVKLIDAVDVIDAPLESATLA
jgi:osmotically-inducible protein OsmY